MQNFEIIAINDSGVRVKNSEFGETVLSGNSPASLVSVDKAEEQEINEKLQLENNEFPIKENKNMTNNDSSVNPNTVDSNKEINNTVERKPKGFYDNILKNVQVPSGNFKIDDLAKLNNLPYTYAAKWVKENCTEAGKAEKVEGQRGKTAILYTK